MTVSKVVLSSAWHGPHWHRVTHVVLDHRKKRDDLWLDPILASSLVLRESLLLRRMPICTQQAAIR
jgi:hypothetical protein